MTILIAAVLIVVIVVALAAVIVPRWDLAVSLRRRMVRDDAGQSVLEVAVLAVVLVGAAVLFGVVVKNFTTSEGSKIQDPNNAPVGAPAPN